MVLIPADAHGRRFGLWVDPMDDEGPFLVFFRTLESRERSAIGHLSAGSEVRYVTTSRREAA